MYGKVEELLNVETPPATIIIRAIDASCAGVALRLGLQGSSAHRTQYDSTTIWDCRGLTQYDPTTIWDCRGLQPTEHNTILLRSGIGEVFSPPNTICFSTPNTIRSDYDLGLGLARSSTHRTRYDPTTIWDCRGLQPTEEFAIVFDTNILKSKIIMTDDLNSHG